MRNIAILYICTGDYWVFWKDFFLTCEKNFIKDYLIEYYVFTDCDDLHEKDNSRVHIIHHQYLGWPDETLLRFHTFLSIEERLIKYEYLFFMNANALIVNRIDAEEFLPVEPGILVVQHPGFYNKSNREFTYERNAESNAYIPEGEGEVYVCGGINGGKTKDCLDMFHCLKEWIDHDREKGIIPIWHDESMLNKYVYLFRNYRLLTCSFCYPEGWKIPYTPKIVVRDKKKWIDVYSVKNQDIHWFESLRAFILRKLQKR